MRKVLILTYYWPPSGGPAVQRITRYARYLHLHGWQPLILTSDAPDSPAIDKSLLGDQDVTVYRSRIFEPFSIYRRLTGRGKSVRLSTNVLLNEKPAGFKEKLARWVRANLFIPDARVGSVPCFYRRALSIVKAEQPDLILCTSPPHSLQLVAKRISKKCNIPYIADLRDPWSEAYWLETLPRTRMAKSLDLALEKSILKAADAVITVSPGLERIFRDKVPNRYEVLFNGFDSLEREPFSYHSFVILFIGELSPIQDPTTLLQAINRFKDNDIKHIELHFIGRTFPALQQILENFPRVQVVSRPYMPFKELLGYSKIASVLFKPFTRTSYSHAIIQSKTFDYMAMRKPILALDTPDSISMQVIEGTLSGRVIHPDDTDAVHQYLNELFGKWQKEKCLLLEDHPGLNIYRASKNVESLARIFDDVISSHSTS